MSEPAKVTDQFFTLTPERLLDAVERALGSAKTGIRATGRCLALNSLENRVYELELDDNSRVVTKFYRPGRWSRETILDEHRFVAELAEGEVPAVVPLTLANGATLDESDDGILFSVYPKARGRIIHELSDDQLRQIGRHLGRLHNIGAARPAPHRLTLDAETYGRRPLEVIKSSGHLDSKLAARYEQLALELLARIEPRFARVPAQRIHGDCHLGNVLWTGGYNESMQTFFLDFDDMVMGPAVQDVWMIVRGRDGEAHRQRDVLLEGYETMRAFDRATLALVEPLRALRLIHYAAWIARRWEDPSFKNAFPDFGSYKYWLEESQALEEQLEQF